MKSLFAIATCFVLTAAAAAEERAATDTLPAAMQFLGMDSSSVLTHSEAQKVRGQGGGKAYGHRNAARGITFINNGAAGWITVIDSKNVRIGSHNQIKSNGKRRGNGFGHNGFTAINNGAIGDITVINSKNVRIGSHNQIKSNGRSGRGGFTAINNGAIGTITVINSKNVRIGSHNKIKF